jgi:hypothetical protein
MWKNIAVATSVAVVACSTSFVVARHSFSDATSQQHPVASITSAQTGADVKSKTAPKDPPQWATSDFPLNASGQTYGSDSAANTAEEMPDLIAVVGDDGTQGFILKSDLLTAEPESLSSPEAALAWQRQIQRDGAPQLAVYDVSGKNRIGTFSLVLGSDEER